MDKVLVLYEKKCVTRWELGGKGRLLIGAAAEDGDAARVAQQGGAEESHVSGGGAGERFPVVWDRRKPRNLEAEEHPRSRLVWAEASQSCRAGAWGTTARSRSYVECSQEGGIATWCCFPRSHFGYLVPKGPKMRKKNTYHLHWQPDIQ